MYNFLLEKSLCIFPTKTNLVTQQRKCHDEITFFVFKETNTKEVMLHAVFSLAEGILYGNLIWKKFLSSK